MLEVKSYLFNQEYNNYNNTYIFSPFKHKSKFKNYIEISSDTKGLINFEIKMYTLNKITISNGLTKLIIDKNGKQQIEIYKNGKILIIPEENYCVIKIKNLKYNKTSINDLNFDNNKNNFDWETYVNKYNDLKIARINSFEKAWKHWRRWGKDEGRIFPLKHTNLNDFDWKEYVNNYDDLKNMGINTFDEAWKHWTIYGQAEGRTYEKYNLSIIDNDVYKNNLQTLEKKNYYKNLVKNRDETALNFINLYETDEKEINENPKMEFRFICYYYINHIRLIELPQIKVGLEKEAVLIEYRCFPHLEFLIRNTILKLGEEWSHTIICGTNNYYFIKLMCEKISSNIKIILTEFKNLNQSTYSQFLTTEEFWNNFIGEKILLYQEDSCLFKKNINDFLEWDYIGAPWPLTQNDTENSVGNGGFSLRSKKCMLEVIKTISLEKTIFNSSTLDYMKNSKMSNGPEDVYFSLNMQVYNIGKVANFSTAFNFSSESIYNPNSLGGHNFWIQDKDWRTRITNELIIPVIPFYNLLYDHRGGWSTILNSLINNKFFCKISEFNFYDMMEYNFLWEKTGVSRNNWAGIFHITPDVPLHKDICNVDNIFKEEKFLISLKKCKYFICLSNYLKKHIEKNLKKINYSIPVYSIKHPVQDVELKFDLNKFINNSKKKLIQIGQQLRIMSSIYLLRIDNYEKIWLTLNKNISYTKEILEKELKYLNININFNDVNMFYTNTFEEYDWYLSENIVFINLFNASANNTILECIIRNTPIIINKLPAVVEYLGEDYPLYFKKLDEVNNLLSNDNIELAHNYLKNMNKDDITIEYFTKQLFNIHYNIMINNK